ncbi:hypothetical protein HH682_00010 [Rosenbergiella sp. S61]|uniref:Uncharacterized protein n=1 Tax=Rosenbergiella gaditana TaxID=2726987 RepID=A0ABS5STU2_9GAMM|nr:hypothetical protein [Rosenbergiella gaditana]MBT0722853.1 hypothetical protein [Rosenbergiella gaditana]
MAAPAQTSFPEPYYPVCELGRDFTLLSWVGKHIGEVENSTCLELSREHIHQLKNWLDCANTTFAEKNEKCLMPRARLQDVFAVRDCLESLLRNFDFEHEHLWFYATW